MTDKHGLSRHAFNLQLELDVGGDVLSLGLGDNELPGRACSTAQSDETADQTAPREQVSTEDLIVDLARCGTGGRATRIRDRPSILLTIV